MNLISSYILRIPHSSHLWRMGLFGVISSIPMAFLITVVTFWLTDYGCSLLRIGMISSTLIPYSLKIFLGPIIQMTSFGFLGKRYGHYRIWIAVSQIGVMFCIALLSFIDPLEKWTYTLILCFSTAIFGALLDCVLEGYRIYSTPETQHSAASGASAMGYRIGLWGTTFIAVMLSRYSWFVAFWGIATLLGSIILISLWRLPQPNYCEEKLSLAQYGKLLLQGWKFFQKTYYFSSVLALIGAQKLGDVFLRSMLPVYLIKMGYTSQEITSIDKGFGIVATIIGIRLGVAWMERKGVNHGFRLWSVLQGLMAALFVAQACWGIQHFWLLFFSTLANYFISGMGGVVLVTYLSYLSKGNDQNDTLRYAMISSLGSFGRTVSAPFAAVVANATMPLWWVFFVIAAFMCLPTFYLSFSKNPFKKRSDQSQKT